LAFFVAESLHAYTHCFGAAFGAHIQRLYDPLYFLGYLISIHSSSITNATKNKTASRLMLTSISCSKGSFEKIFFNNFKKAFISKKLVYLQSKAGESFPLPPLFEIN